MAVTEQENELGAKNEVALKSEKSTLPSNPDEEESEGMKELVMEEKTEEAGK